MSKKINIGYILTYFFYHSLTAVIYGFGLYSLIQRGYSSSEAGISLALASVVGLILQPLLSNISDNSKKFGQFEMAIVCAIGTIIFSILNYLSHTNNLILQIAYIMNIAFYIACEPFINAFSSLFEKANININFAVVRAFGSLSYSIFCFVLGKLTIIYDYPSVTISLVLLSVLLLLVIIYLNNEYKKIKIDIKKEKEDTVSYKEFIKNNKGYILIIVFLSIIYFAYMCFDNYMLLAIEYIGGNSGDNGSILSFKAIFEMIGMMFIFPIISKKINLNTILKISAISFLIKILLETIAPNLFVMYLAQIFQGLSFSFLYPGMVMYVNKHISLKEVTRGQACITMACSIGNIFSSLAAGIIADSLGIKAMEYVALVSIIIGSLGFIFAINKNGK